MASPEKDFWPTRAGGAALTHFVSHRDLPEGTPGRGVIAGLAVAQDMVVTHCGQRVLYVPQTRCRQECKRCLRRMGKAS